MRLQVRLTPLQKQALGEEAEEKAMAKFKPAVAQPGKSAKADQGQGKAAGGAKAMPQRAKGLIKEMKLR